MVRELVSFGTAAYLRNFFFERQAYPFAASRITLFAFGIGLGVLFWRGSSATRRTAVGLVSLSLGAYLAVGLGRAFLARSAPTMTTLASEHRYHHVASIPIVILTCLALEEIGRFAWLRAVPRSLLLAAALVVGGYGFVRSDFLVDDHAGARELIQRELQAMADEVRSVPTGATAYLENGRASPVLVGPVLLHQQFPGRAAIFILSQPDDELAGRQVRFVERDPQTLRWYGQWPETRLAHLLVGPDAVARRP
jgi:hypothetical protein